MIKYLTIGIIIGIFISQVYVSFAYDTDEPDDCMRDCIRCFMECDNCHAPSGTYMIPN